MRLPEWTRHLTSRRARVGYAATIVLVWGRDIWRAVTWSVRWAGDVEILTSNWSAIDQFLQGGWGTFTSFVVGALIVASAVRRGLRQQIVDAPGQAAQSPDQHDPKGEVVDENATPFPFDTEHFLKSIFVTEVKVGQKKLDGPTPHVNFSIQIVNGSGFPIEFEKEIAGRMQIRGTFLSPADFISSMGPLNLTMPYPKNGHYEIRQFIDRDLLMNEIAVANTPNARAADRMFGADDDPGPNIMLDMKELELQVTARKGQISHEFQMPLYNHSVMVVL